MVSWAVRPKPWATAPACWRPRAKSPMSPVDALATLANMSAILAAWLASIPKAWRALA
ncbi:Uncharacterised protein [Mycobacteroides abscessus subsp. bolletii]|nr:Uncharacterised protein [Mycobacteroides abscessus subsp. bolletii]